MSQVRKRLLFITTPFDLSVYLRFSSSVRGFPGEINLPVFAPGFAAIDGSVTLPVRSPICDLGPGEPRENLAPSLVLPLAVKIDRATNKSSPPDQKATRRRGVGPRVLPIGGLRIE